MTIHLIPSYVDDNKMTMKQKQGNDLHTLLPPWQVCQQTLLQYQFENHRILPIFSLSFLAEIHEKLDRQSLRTRT